MDKKRAFYIYRTVRVVVGNDANIFPVSRDGAVRDEARERI
jgi:hypothetical protein